MMGLKILSPTTRYKLLAYISKRKIHCPFIKGKRRKNMNSVYMGLGGGRHKEMSERKVK